MASERVDALEALQATEEQADGERYLTVQEAADYLSVSRSALYTMSASGGRAYAQDRPLKPLP